MHCHGRIRRNAAPRSVPEPTPWANHLLPRQRFSSIRIIRHGTSRRVGVGGHRTSEYAPADYQTIRLDVSDELGARKTRMRNTAHLLIYNNSY